MAMSGKQLFGIALLIGIVAPVSYFAFVASLPISTGMINQFVINNAWVCKEDDGKEPSLGLFLKKGEMLMLGRHQDVFVSEAPQVYDAKIAMSANYSVGSANPRTRGDESTKNDITFSSIRANSFKGEINLDANSAEQLSCVADAAGYRKMRQTLRNETGQ